MLRWTTASCVELLGKWWLLVPKVSRSQFKNSVCFSYAFTFQKFFHIMAPFNHSHFQTTIPTDTSNKTEGLSPNAIKGIPDPKGSLTKWKVRFFLRVNWKGRNTDTGEKVRSDTSPEGHAISWIHMRVCCLLCFPEHVALTQCCFLPCGKSDGKAKQVFLNSSVRVEKQKARVRHCSLCIFLQEHGNGPCFCSAPCSVGRTDED